MAVIQDIIAALWQHDFAALANPHVVSVVYFVMVSPRYFRKRSAASIILTWR